MGGLEGRGHGAGGLLGVLPDAGAAERREERPRRAPGACRRVARRGQAGSITIFYRPGRGEAGRGVAPLFNKPVTIFFLATFQSL